MSKNNRQEVSDFLYPPLQKIVDNQNSDVEENPISDEPIYFNPNILCCPYCGGTNLWRGGLDKHGNQRFICKRKHCESYFIDPAQRRVKPKKKSPKRTKDNYFHSERLCCPACGNEDLRKAGKEGGKQQYLCKREECSRCFVDPSLRANAIVDGVSCKFCGSHLCVKHSCKRDKKRRYKCHGCGRSFTPGSTRDCYPKHIPLSEDVWDAQSLGVKPSPTKSLTKFNFTNIQQVWLKEAVKAFIRIQAPNHSFSTIQGYIVTMNHFSSFLTASYPSVDTVSQINRKMVVDFLCKMRSSGIKETSINHKISGLKMFFEVGNTYKLFRVDANSLITKRDYPRIPESIPRFIPSYILKQLNEHLDWLPEPVARMVIVLQACGMRYRELATIPFNCLVCLSVHGSEEKKWSIRFYDYKLKQDRMLPISDEIASIVKKQQRFIRSYFGDSHEYLFTGRDLKSNTKSFYPSKDRVMSLDSFNVYLNNLAKDYNIKDENGKLWEFSSHQFRHTVGTEAIQNGVPFHIVMKLLGHSSPTMTLRYAHIHDETLRNELLFVSSK